MKIYRVSESVITEYGVKADKSDRFFTSKTKANRFIDDEKEVMSCVASCITDKTFSRCVCRSVKIFIGKEGYHTHFTLDTIEVE